ncbi:GNAT family N-acetyltransferase [Streptomyces sp. JJ38]|uniref:GNAT family N-acetyltransferase n=1 Tax=Streptomyces sp. JJ38 TaxID=2738128 RepID=UPI001C563781|nr:GNAT family N-acetyltransferase [Streptomyces sp. JJ38]MBW1599687.1 GNAT family N-acetyltransferase [Streptomyces sp. JJ38]
MTSRFPDISISTDRLVLRPFEEADIPALTDMMNDELVTAWTDAPHPYTRADAREWVTRQAPRRRTDGGGIALAVTEFLTGRLVGSVELRRTDWRTAATEACYVVAPWARGEGYAAETLLAVSTWLFRDQGFARLELRTAADNTAAQQVAQKVGCISEGVLRSAGTTRVRTEEHGPPAPPATSASSTAAEEWTDVRTDLIVWSLLPEDLDETPDEPPTVVERTPAKAHGPLG